MPMLDSMKGAAAQLIVLHHLASYGPLAEAISSLLPQMSSFLFDYGRMVVQVFLVIGGYLAMRSLSTSNLLQVANPLAMIWRRYLRLVVPFMAAMLLAILGAEVARGWLSSEVVPGTATIGQLLAHGLLLHGVFDVPSLSAGVWYVAIDLQLFALLLLLLWSGQRIVAGRPGRVLGGIMVAGLACSALFYFNRDDGWDAWGIYFFGSYALGAFAWWVSTRTSPWRWFLVGALLVGLALVLDFRLRIALALGVATILVFATTSGQLGRWPRSRVSDWLGRISYSVFLVHFPVCLVVNGLYARFFDGNDVTAMAAIVAAWLLSLAAGDLFYRHVESRRNWLPAPVSQSAR